jgi:hypothetical protein
MVLEHAPSRTLSIIHSNGSANRFTRMGHLLKNKLMGTGRTALNADTWAALNSDAPEFFALTASKMARPT